MAMRRAADPRGDVTCAGACGLWHRRIAGSCVGRGMWGRDRAVVARGDAVCAGASALSSSGGVWEMRVWRSRS